MNTLSGQISSVETKGSLSLVKLQVEDIILTTIVIDTPETARFLQAGNAVKALFKETEVVLSLDAKQAISIENRLIGTIETIEQGDLLVKVVLQIGTLSISSIITTESFNALNLASGAQVTALIKSNEIMLSH